MKKGFKILKVAFLLFALMLLFTGIINLYMLCYARKYIYSTVNDIPEKYTVIVPGAKVYSGYVSHVVRDRIEAANDCLEKCSGQGIYSVLMMQLW